MEGCRKRNCPSVRSPLECLATKKYAKSSLIVNSFDHLLVSFRSSSNDVDCSVFGMHVLLTISKLSSLRNLAGADED